MASSVELRRKSLSITATATASVLLLLPAIAAWVVALRQMGGMDMGPATGLRSPGFFFVLWVPMMAAMMLPGALPAVVRHARAASRMRALPVFLGLYVAVWALVGLPVYALYRPHGYVAAGMATIAAGGYELTPLKAHFRRRCHETISSGLQFGLYCVGSSLGLMLVFVALGIMSVTWMSLVAALVVAQKVVPPRAAFDLPMGLAIIGLGALVVAGFVPSV